jgi:predicted aspartyl protease
MVVDSGSSQTIVSAAFVREHLRECKQFRYKGGSVQTADDGVVEPDGVVMAEIEIGGHARIHPFVVFPNLPVPILLGTDWLHQTGAHVDFGLQTISFADSMVPVTCRVVQHHTPAQLRILQTTVLPPQSGTWVPVSTLSNHTFAAIPSAMVGVSGDRYCMEMRGITTPQAFYTLRHGKTNIFLVNTTAQSIRLRPSNTVAMAYPDAPAPEQLQPLNDHVYDLAGSSQKGGEALSEHCVLLARMSACATFLGISQTAMLADELLLVKETAEKNVDEWGKVRDERVKLLMKTKPDSQNRMKWVQDFSQKCYLAVMGNPNADTPSPPVGKDPNPEMASEVYTPDEIIQAVRNYYGDRIELDPASNKLANKGVGAKQYFTRETDGLQQPWHARRIFVNPPFADMSKWVPKILQESKTLINSREKEMFVLVPYRETAWFKDLFPEATLAMLPHKKHLFWSPEKGKLSIRDPLMLLYFGPQKKIALVTRHFQDLFLVTQPKERLEKGSYYKSSDSMEDEPVPSTIPIPEGYDPITHVGSIGKDKVVTDEQRSRLETLIRKFPDVVNPSPGHCRVGGARVETGNAKPINLPLRRLSPAQQEEASKQIQEMLEMGLICPSTSPWAAGIVLAPKPDGSWRFCIDYREINKVTVRDSYPLPRVDEYLHALEQNTWFSVMDLNAGFWQVPLHPEDAPKTAFLSHDGLFEWIRMPMGLTNSPAIFQRVMDLAFAGMTWRNLLVYVDDVLIMSPSFDQHLEDLEEAFMRLIDIDMTIKPKKCHFVCGKLKYLGHLVTEEGIRPNPEKVKAIKEMPFPDSPEKMASFLGLVSYYRDYIKGCSSIAEPLQEMAKLVPSEYPKEPSDKQKEAFRKLCDALINEDCVLIKPGFTKPFILQTDASNYGLGAVLTQRDANGKERVISYASRTLLKAERKWHTHELEALAAIWGCEHFRPYLIGRKFLLETDHHSLQWLRDQRRPGRLERWVLRLAEYDFDVKHRPGKDNGNAESDGPLRNPVEYDPEDEEKLNNLSEALPAEPFSFYVREYHRHQREWKRKELNEIKENERLKAFYLLDAALVAQ